MWLSNYDGKGALIWRQNEIRIMSRTSWLSNIRKKSRKFRSHPKLSKLSDFQRRWNTRNWRMYFLRCWLWASASNANYIALSVWRYSIENIITSFHILPMAQRDYFLMNPNCTIIWLNSISTICSVNATKLLSCCPNLLKRMRSKMYSVVNNL